MLRMLQSGGGEATGARASNGSLDGPVQSGSLLFHRMVY